MLNFDIDTTAKFAIPFKFNYLEMLEMTAILGLFRHVKSRSKNLLY